MGYPTFAVGDVLSANDMNAVGLWKIAPSGVTNGTLSDGVVTIGSAVSSVTVSGVFSSLFDDYLILYKGIAFSAGAGANSFFLRFNNSTGSTYEYGGSWRQITAASFSGTQATATNLGIWLGLTGANAANSFGKIHVLSPNLATRTFVLGETGNNEYIMTNGGADTNAVAQTAFSFNLPSGGGTMTGGTIRIYGYRK